MSHVVAIDASPKQLSKLRNGHPVRIRKGTGFNVIVHPGTYNLVQKAFAKSKGIQVQLTPEEIQMNRSLSPEQHQAYMKQGMAGQGIFDTMKSVGKEALKTLVKEAAPGLIKKGLKKGAEKLTEKRGPMAKKLAELGADKLGDLAAGVIEKKMSGGAMVSGIVASPARSMSAQVSKAIKADKMNDMLGTNFDYMGRAGIDSAIKNMMSSKMSSDAVGARRMLGGQLKRDGEVMSHTKVISSHPALTSQALDANFLMYNMLPPQFQTLKGKGLYAGAGLYARSV